MSKQVEVERTFLVKFLPDEVQGIVPDELKDTYITKGSGSSILRLRRKNDYCEITKKSIVDKADASTHTEESFEITLEEYEKLAAVSDLKIEKQRYSVVINGYAAEVDVFCGDLAGLVVIDFEFSSVEEMNVFNVPECCLADVTQDKEISAGCLVGKTYDDLQKWLNSYNYEKL